MPGRPKESNARKLAKGSNKIHAGEDLTPEYLTAMPDTPPDLNEDGQQEWQRVCTLFMEEQLLTEWDLTGIKIMCMEWERYISAKRDIDLNGAYQASPKSGYEQQRPIVAERDKGFANYAKLLGLYGGNAVSRARIKRVKPIEKGKNPFETL